MHTKLLDEIFLIQYEILDMGKFTNWMSSAKLQL